MWHHTLLISAEKEQALQEKLKGNLCLTMQHIMGLGKRLTSAKRGDAVSLFICQLKQNMILCNHARFK